MLKQATADLDSKDGSYIKYHLDSSLVNFQCRLIHTMTQEQVNQDLLFADDAAIIINTVRALKHITSCIAEITQLFRLAVRFENY